MDWDSLFSTQKKLDTYIAEQWQLDGNTLFEERFLALLVELGELANETRCFKFWSQKDRSSKDIILEEYVDNIHFLLSIGLEMGCTFAELEPSKIPEIETKVFNHVFARAIHFYENQTKEAYLEMFRAYLGLAIILGFSGDDITQAYHEKNEVNYARQESGY